MKKSDIEYILKRMPQIEKAIKRKQAVACFYVGNRKEVIPITANVYLIREIVEDVIKKGNNYIREIVEYHIKQGKSDIFILTQLPMAKNCYYRLKNKIHERIFNCCIERGAVSYDEIFIEEII